MAGQSFLTALCYHVTVQTPQSHVEHLLKAVVAVDQLTWGDYDQVSFITVAGQQRFRTLEGARNLATEDVQAVDCVELSFSLAADADLQGVLGALCEAHAYEEPVIVVSQALRTLHVRGTGHDNANRFWNRPTEDWVPAAHR